MGLAISGIGERVYCPMTGLALPPNSRKEIVRSRIYLDPKGAAFECLRSPFLNQRQLTAESRPNATALFASRHAVSAQGADP